MTNSTKLTKKQATIQTVIADHKGTIEEQNAFVFMVGNDIDKVAYAVCKACYHIGTFMMKLDENYSQPDAKEIRDTYLEGAGLLLTRNDTSACKQIAKAFKNASEAEKVYKATGTRSVSPARIWATINPKKSVAPTLEAKIKAKIKAIETATNDALKLIKTLDDKKTEIELVQLGMTTLVKSNTAVKTVFEPLTKTDVYQEMVKELAETENKENEEKTE